MNYSRWVASRRAVWDEVDARIGAALRHRRDVGFADLEELALGYRRLLHDAAVARARFPGSAAARRLDRLALKGAFLLQGEADRERFTLSRFYGVTFPRACRRIRPHLGAAVALFLVSALFAALAALSSPGLGLRLLGPERMNDLAQGKLWTQALTTAVPPGVSASGIATNNMTVALVAWSGGLLAGFGPIYALVVNGAMLGGLFGVTYHFGMAGRLAGFVLAHGPLEIFLVLMCAAAGLYLAQGLVVAADVPRSATLRRHGKVSLTVVAGSLPWFLLLGLVEALISPMPGVPVFLKVAVGILLLASYLLVAFRDVETVHAR